MNPLPILVALCLWVTQLDAATLSDLPDPTQPDASRSSSNQVNSRGKNANALFSLQQTIVSPQRKSAVINGKAMVVGDKINGATLIKISKDRVFLQRNREIIELRLITQKGIKETNR